MSEYQERDAYRVVLMRSDDGGVTWHAPNSTVLFREQDCCRAIVLKAVGVDAWRPEDWSPPS